MSIQTHPVSRNGGIKEIGWHPETAVADTRSIFSLVEMIYDFGGKCRCAEVFLSNMSVKQAKQWQGFFLGLNGQAGLFYLQNVKGFRNPDGVATGLPVVATGNSPLASNLLTEGWTTDVEGIMLRGDEFSIDDRIYTVTADVDSDSSGDATISIWPNLPGTVPADSTSLDIGDDCRGVFRLEELPGWVNRLGDYQDGLSFNVREALNQ
jgi:hypothetical protein